MSEKRVNPETGVLEESCFTGWKPTKNGEGREERVNPDTGVKEESRFTGWTPSKNAEGREERVNPDTGVQEESRFTGWTPSKNAEGREERVNPDTGVQEENRFAGWTPSGGSGSRSLRPPPIGQATSRPGQSADTSDSSDSSSGCGGILLIVLVLGAVGVGVSGGFDNLSFNAPSLPNLLEGLKTRLGVQPAAPAGQSPSPLESSPTVTGGGIGASAGGGVGSSATVINYGNTGGYNAGRVRGIPNGVVNRDDNRGGVWSSTFEEGFGRVPEADGMRVGVGSSNGVVIKDGNGVGVLGAGNSTGAVNRVKNGGVRIVSRGETLNVPPNKVNRVKNGGVRIVVDGVVIRDDNVVGVGSSTGVVNGVAQSPTPSESSFAVANCPLCAKPMSVPREHWHSVFNCPHCKASLTVTSPTDGRPNAISVQCRVCSKPMTVPRAQWHMTFNCPHCQAPGALPYPPK